MVISEGQSEYITLRPTSTKVYVLYAGGASGTLTAQVGKRKGELIPIEVNGVATITASSAFIVDGAGLLSFDADSVSGTITVETD